MKGEPGRSRMYQRRRLAWVSAGAIVLIMTGSAILTGAVGTASASPDLICCGEFFSNVSVADNSTNVTISYTAAFSNLTPFAIHFGNTSSGEIYSQPATYSNTTLKGHVFLDYLQPNTTYDFELFIASTCVHYPVEYYCTYSSSFKTGIDTYGIQQNGYNTISGSVANAAGTAAPNGLAVAVTCEDGPYYTWAQSTDFVSTDYSGSGVTGHFTAGFPPTLNYCPKGIEVEVLNYPTAFDGGTGQWAGYFNETVFAFAPQAVNILLPSNVLGALTPEVLDFTNDSYVTFGYQSTFYASTSSCWSLEGQQSCTSFTSSNLVGLAGSAGHNLEYYVAYMTTGSVEFNAISGRTAQLLSWSYIGQPVSTELNSSIVSDPVSAFYTGIGSTEVCHTQAAGAGTATYTTTYSQSFQLSSAFNLDISVGVDLYGVSFSAPLLEYSNSLSNGGGSAWTMSYTIHVPSGGSTTNVWVYVQPGSSNQVGPVVHAWAGPSCPP